MSREQRREAEAYALAEQQADAAVEASETDDSTTDPDHALEAEEEPE